MSTRIVDIITKISNKLNLMRLAKLFLIYRMKMFMQGRIFISKNVIKPLKLNLTFSKRASDHRETKSVEFSIL
jgi:hypothetical protein